MRYMVQYYEHGTWKVYMIWSTIIEAEQCARELSHPTRIITLGT